MYGLRDDYLTSAVARHTQCADWHATPYKPRWACLLRTGAPCDEARLLLEGHLPCGFAYIPPGKARHCLLDFFPPVARQLKLLLSTPKAYALARPGPSS